MSRASRASMSSAGTSAGITRWLVRICRPFLTPLAGSFVAAVLGNLAQAALFALAAGGIVAITGGFAVAPVLWGLVALSLFKAVMRYLEQFLGHWVAFAALEHLRTVLFGALWPKAPAITATARSGDLLVRQTKDVDRIEVFFAHTLVPAATAVTAPLVTVLVIGAWAGWPVALAGAIGLLLVVAVLPAIGRGRARRQAARAGNLRGRVAQHLTDDLGAKREITNYGAAPRRLAELDRLDDALERTERTSGRLSALRSALTTAILFATLVGVLLTAHATATNGVAAVASLAAIAAAFTPARAIADFGPSLDRALAAAQRVREVVDSPPAVSDPAQPEALPAAPPGRAIGLAFDHVTYSYPRAVAPAVADATLEAPAGAWTCLVGASGSGKSTLAQLAVRVDDPAHGTVRAGGVDVRAVALDDLRGRVALVEQRTHLFPGTVAENLRLASPAASDADCRDALRAAVLDVELDRPATHLSGGQIQRLALARGLLTGADVLVLDEVTAHLDPALAAHVRASLRRARPGATVLEITHRLEGIADADHVVVTDAGRVLESGSPAELLADPASALHVLADRA